MLQEEKPDDVWNPTNWKWTKPAIQIGYKTLTAQKMFTDMKDEMKKSSGFKSYDIGKSFLKQENVILEEMALLTNSGC